METNKKQIVVKKLNEIVRLYVRVDSDTKMSI